MYIRRRQPCIFITYLDDFSLYLYVDRKTERDHHASVGQAKETGNILRPFTPDQRLHLSFLSVYVRNLFWLGGDRAKATS